MGDNTAFMTEGLSKGWPEGQELVLEELMLIARAQPPEAAKKLEVPTVTPTHPTQDPNSPLHGDATGSTNFSPGRQNSVNLSATLSFIISILRAQAPRVRTEIGREMEKGKERGEEEGGHSHRPSSPPLLPVPTHSLPL